MQAFKNRISKRESLKMNQNLTCSKGSDDCLVPRTVSFALFFAVHSPFHPNIFDGTSLDLILGHFVRAYFLDIWVSENFARYKCVDDLATITV